MKILDATISLLGVNKTSYLFIFLGISFWFLGNVFGAEDPKLSFGIITIWRGFSTIVLTYLVMKIYHQSSDLKSPSEFRILIIRNLISTFNGVFFTISLKYISSPIVQTINNVGPITVFFWDYMLNNRIITKKEVLGTVMATVSIMVTIYASQHTNTHSSSFHYYEISTIGKVVVCGLFLGSVFLWGYAIVITKRLKHANSLLITNNVGILCVIVGGLYTVVEPKELAFQWRQYLWVFTMVGGLMALSGFFYIGGIKITENMGASTLINFVTVIEAYMFSIFRYGQQVTLLAVAGSVGVFVSLVIMTSS